MTAGCVLFVAAMGGSPVSIMHAETHELAAFAGQVEHDLSRDMLDPWAVISIRRDDIYGAKLHALGWRTGLVNTWITSPLVAIDPDHRAVLTGSGNVYALGRREGTDLHPLLREHLAYALRTWGFEDVR